MPPAEAALAMGAGRDYSPVMRSAPAPNLEIKLFGGLEIRRAGELVPLPQSKKTRALLAYLILKGAPQRRDALCELLWEIPDDPRGALRWSLSKLRPLVNDDSAERLTADRERVAFEKKGARVDLLHAEEVCAAGLGRLDADELLALCNVIRGSLLEGLELPSQPAFETWRLAQREKARRLHIQVMDERIARSDPASAEHARLLQRRIEIDPDNKAAHHHLIAHLARTNPSQAKAQADLSARMLADVGGLDEAKLKAALHQPLEASKAAAPATTLRQDIRFCTASDGVRLAYATVGSGPPLVKTANWLNHLEFDWDSPIWRHVFHALARDNTFIRYDARGNGLSDWNVENLSLDTHVEDLKAVVDAAGVDRFPLFAMSQGCAVAAEFAVRYPERVSKLILYGGYARGWRSNPDSAFSAQTEALLTLTRTGWGKDNPAYRQVFTSLFIPGATPEQMTWFNELQRVTTSPDNAARIMSSLGDIDVRPRLPLVTQPTLVIHARNDARVPYFNGRELAAGIPGARFVTLESNNHLLLEQEPAWPRFLAELRAFLAE